MKQNKCQKCENGLVWEIRKDNDLNEVYCSAFCPECGIIYYKDLEEVDLNKNEKWKWKGTEGEKKVRNFREKNEKDI